MIVKSISHTTRNSPKKLIQYIFDGRKSLLDPRGDRLVFKQHLRSYDKDKWINQFNELESNRRSHYANRSVVCYHEVVSFSDKSTQYLNRIIIKDLVQRYISLRTEGTMLCVGAVHFDKGKNWHAHLVFSGIRTTDCKSARISKKRLASIKQELQTYQVTKYPQLEDSVVRHGLKKKELTNSYSEKETQLKKRMAVPSDKDVLFEKVQGLFHESTSLQQFEKLLSKENIKTYRRAGKITGVYYKQRKYRLKRTRGIDIELLLLKDKTLERVQSLREILEERDKGLSKGYDLEL